MIERVIIQARTSSRRLPRKSLLPLGGLPLAVLAALRASRNGADVVVATSVQASDDGLASTLTRHGVKVFRGPLDDVLLRYVQASADLRDDDRVVRLTGDNVFPDADFVNDLLAFFDASGADHVGTDSPKDGLPYGLSGEVFTVDALQRAQQNAVDDFDREHVTPWIKRNLNSRLFDAHREAIDLGALRCTIDTNRDYQRQCRVFASLKDPVGIPWRDLCKRLEIDAARHGPVLPWRRVGTDRHARIVLGTAQLGMPYGIANRHGMPDADDAREIILSAVDRGVTHIDTARGYGEAESRIGAALVGGEGDEVTIITKIGGFERLDRLADQSTINDFVDASVFRSCRDLRVDALDTLLLHSAQPLETPGSGVMARLFELREDGVIGRLGLSVQNPAELAMAAAHPGITHIQLPFNILDWRWHDSDLEGLTAARPELVIHVRSAYLQGLLLSDSPNLWPMAGGCAAQLMAKLKELTTELGRENVADLCLAYVNAQPWVHGIVTGVESLQQLAANCRYAANPCLTADEIARVGAELPRAEASLLDPSLWPRRGQKVKTPT
jgi:spore coat polysaccharide biosynthesis protein SpsF (cytidylyltransferase family)/aryl-alcohol dehydrogenase-like predicted oxidoreductase